MVSDPLVVDENMNSVTVNQSFTNSSFVWMQSTGLHDKNGKEIYEGDILRISEKAWRDNEGQDAYDGNTRNREVRWESGMFIVHGEALALSQYEPEDIEVIDNIYENPDLLKEAT